MGPFPEPGPGAANVPPHPPAPPSPAPAPPFLPQLPGPQPSRGTDAVGGGARAAGKRPGERPAWFASSGARGASLATPAPWARPAPVAAASSLGTLGAAHRSGAGSDHVASSSPGCKLTERGTTPAAATPPLACAGSGPRWWASPPLRAPRSDSHRLPCAPNCREASRPPREVRRRAGSAQDAAPTAGDEGVGKEAEGYGTNGLDAPSQAHRSSDPEGAGPEPRAAPAPGTD